MKIFPNASAAALHVEPGATVIIDAWQGYAGIDKLGASEACDPHSPVRWIPPDPLYHSVLI